MTVTIEHPSASLPDAQPRSWKLAMARGLFMRCPACGSGGLFQSFLKVRDKCPSCGEELHHHRADDAPPYFTIFIVGHIIIPLVLLVEVIWRPPLLVHGVLWGVLTLALTFALMPAVKGAVVGLQWALRMHGFDENARRDGTADL